MSDFLHSFAILTWMSFFHSLFRQDKNRAAHEPRGPKLKASENACEDLYLPGMKGSAFTDL
jgi:hypothetical protein